jgi:hypothetical protein
LKREFARPRSSLSTIIGINVPEVVSANTSATPSTNTATSTRPADSTSAATASVRPSITAARPRFAPTTIRLRSWRSAITPAYRPNISHGRRCNSAAIATRNGRSVCEATSSGPAARPTPSPRLVIHDEASNLR